MKANTTSWVEISDDGRRLQGWLADDLGRRLVGRPMVLRSGETTRNVVTDAGGAFDVPFTFGAGAQTVRVDFGGDHYHQASQFTRRIDPSRLPVDLHLTAPTTATLDTSLVEIQVRAEHREQPIQIPVRVSAGNSDRAIVQGRTDRTGWTHLGFDPRMLGQPGRHQLLAVFDGDDRFGPSLARAEILLVDATEVTLGIEPVAVLPEDQLRARGRLLGTFGPLPGEEITLETDGRNLARGMTDGSGGYDLRFDAEGLQEPGTHRIVARYRSSLSTRQSSDSEAVDVELREPSPLSWGQLVTPAAATIALVLLVLLATRRHKRGRDARGRAAPEAVETGLRLSQIPQRRLRRVVAHDFTGRAWDPVDERPVPGATVTVEVEGERLTSKTGKDGGFRFGDMAPGTHRVSVDAEEYVPEIFRIELPHSGAYHGTTVQIVQVRHRVQEIYRAIARPLLPRRAFWGRWTPRELAIHAVKTHPWMADEIAELTSFFEGIYYSSAERSLADLDRARRLAERIDRTESDAVATDG